MSHKFSNSVTFGCVSYINALPFSLQLLSNAKMKLVLAPPAKLLSKLLNNEIDLALTSAVGAISHKLRYLPGWGIAAYKRIQSVNLYASPTFFSSPEPRIAITKESRSSVALLRILCQNLWQIPTPRMYSCSSSEVATSSPDTYEGLLLIGDSALKHPTIPGFTTYDLVQSWDELTGLPFVFAVVLCNPSWKENSLPILTLNAAFSHFERSPKEVLETAHKRTSLSYQQLEQYYSLCRYRLEDEDYAGLKIFKKYYETLYQQT
ncbi:menaquinone biosynthesis protein [Chlamydia sp. 17-3921]|uniref:menaquinone biosynthesis protein n=1 Tax=Chlamydia sp. 17-3921 TaxID=2675798 RepID=UPI0019198834|nr:menaquinone biosynthesis protein [Chlamydia sp. 17-3921]